MLGGVQIDGDGNINLVGTAGCPRTEMRSFGSAQLWHLVPRSSCFRQEHSPGLHVPKVDFISAAASRRRCRAAAVPARCPPAWPVRFRPGAGPRSPAPGAPGFTAAEVHADTGFDDDGRSAWAATAGLDMAMLALLRGRILDEVSERYLAFAKIDAGPRQPFMSAGRPPAT